MKRRIPFILGALLGLMCMALLSGCIGHSAKGTGIPGERADHRACAIAFARENRSVLRNAARVLNKLRPAPKLVYLEDGPEDYYIIANYGIGGDVQLTDPELQDALLPDPWGS